MVEGFYEDLEQARAAETIVCDKLSSLAPGIKFENVGNDRQYFHKGDIKATLESGKEVFVEVKDDSCIHRTRNVLCEEEVYFNYNGVTTPGNMYSDYEIYCVLSQKERKMYLIDFDILRKNYKKGEYKEIQHPAQTTYCYLCSLAQIKKWGAMIKVIKY